MKIHKQHGTTTERNYKYWNNWCYRYIPLSGNRTGVIKIGGGGGEEWQITNAWYTLNLSATLDSKMRRNHIHISSRKVESVIQADGCLKTEQKISASKVLSNDVIHLLLKLPPRQKSLVPPGWEPGKGRTMHVLTSHPPLPGSNPRWFTEEMKQVEPFQEQYLQQHVCLILTKQVLRRHSRDVGNSLRGLMGKSRGLVAASWKAG